MKVQTEIRLAVGALLAVQILTSFGTIALLSRMTPAIARIVEDNLYSIRAAEGMLATLAHAGAADDAARADLRANFEEAFARARGNVTESAEEPVLERIERSSPRALDGDPRAVAATIEALQVLIEINQTQTLRTDQRAQALGRSGAWAAAFLGFVGLLLSALAIRRLTGQVIDPLEEMRSTMVAFRDGDPHRRCHSVGFPRELVELSETFDDLLDRVHGEGAAPSPPLALAQVDRMALLHLLDQREEPVAIVDREGSVLATNQAALAALDEPLRAALRRAARGEEEPTVRREPIGDLAWLCELDPGALGDLPAPLGPEEE